MNRRKDLEAPVSTPIRTLAALVDAVQALIDSSGKRVYAEDLHDVLDRVEDPASRGGQVLDVQGTEAGKASVERRR